jgi:hypothetical protein
LEDSLLGVPGAGAAGLLEGKKVKELKNTKSPLHDQEAEKKTKE